MLYKWAPPKGTVTNADFVSLSSKKELPGMTEEKLASILSPESRTKPFLTLLWPNKEWKMWNLK